MRRSIILAAMVLLFSVSSSTQDVEHAPTAQQCQADQALWMSKLEESSSPSSGWAHSANDVASRTLVIWSGEMNDCFAVDPDNKQKYLDTTEHIFAVMGARQADFLIRHNLIKQFFDEDDAGKR